MDVSQANMQLLTRLDIGNIAGCEKLFSPDFVFHYFNRHLPDLEGDYEGTTGLQDFFLKLGSRTGGTFKSTPQSATPYGDKLVVSHAKHTLTIEGQALNVDAAVVWRFENGRIVEAWDIPAVQDEPQKNTT